MQPGVHLLTSTAISKYIESTSEDGSKTHYCCTEIYHSSGDHAGYLYLNISAFTSISTLDNLVNALISLIQFYYLNKDPKDNKILNTDVIVEFEKNENERSDFYIERKVEAKKNIIELIENDRFLVVGASKWQVKGEIRYYYQE